ncbi:DNA-binding protein [Fodinisporobacter ferrooxydans]|uniref:DNA-binding protein n=1 Tax=Fodinisporobacter ferrooxydans TaxID=2901836 RepID=A0ABY4CMS5_9BACL|nr:DNA-binding protein [Alicyclobacillaceae bacterium MYW30-H2]
MYLQFETKDEFIRWIQENLLSPHEVSEYLGVTPQAVNQSVKNGKLVPIKQEPRFSLFLKEDVENRKEELQTLRTKYRPWESDKK